MQHQNLQHICAVMHTKEEIFFFKKVQKHTKSKIAACLRGNSRWPLFFVKLYMSLPIHRCIDLSNTLRISRDSIFLKLFVIPGGNALPKNPTGGFFCHPYKSKWEVPRNIPHHLAKLLHAV